MYVFRKFLAGYDEMVISQYSSTPVFRLLYEFNKKKKNENKKKISTILAE